MGLKKKLLSIVTALTLVTVLVAPNVLMHAGATGSLSVSGEVTDQSNNDVDGVSVTATAPGSSTTLFGPAVSASDGQYTLNVDPGVYDIHFTPAVGSNLNPLVIGSKSIQSSQTLNAKLTPQSSTRTLSGIMTDANGNPIPYLGIELHDNNNRNIVIKNTFADSTGHYSMQVPAGVYTNVRLRTFITGYSSIGNTDVAYPDLGDLGDMNLDLTNSDLIKNFALNLTKLKITVKDSAGNPQAGATMNYLFDGDPNNGFVDFGKTTVNAGTDNYRLQIVQITNNAEHTITDSNGVYTVLVPQGGKFPSQTSRQGRPLCVTYVSGARQCAPYTFNTTTDVNMIFQEGQGVVSTPIAPTSLSASSPSQYPNLAWDAVTNATSYNVYRNGVNVGSSATNSYLDTTAPNGNLDYYVTAVNGAGESIPSDTITITPPVIDSANSASTGMRANFNFQVTTASSYPAPALTVSGALPNGLSFTDNGNGTGNFSGMAAVGTAGTYPLTITATGSGRVSTQTFTLTVTTAPSAPDSLTSNTGSTDINAYYGTALDPVTITSTGYPVPRLTKTSPLPNGVTFRNNGNGTATISGTPSGNAVGPYTFTITSTNSSGTYSQAYTIYVYKAPTITAISNAKLKAKVGDPYSLAIATKGYEYPSIYVSNGSLPSGLSLNNNGDGSATISGTPDIGWGGTYPVTVTAANSMGSTDYSFTITVSETPTITSADNDTITFGVPMTPFTVTTSGYPAANLRASGLPLGVRFRDNNDGTGTISGTPLLLARGTHNVTITATNSAGSVTQAFTLVVQ